MKNSILIIYSVLLFMNCTNNSVSSTNSDAPKVEMSEKLRHVVLFKFKETASKDDVKTIEKAFMDLSNKIEQVRDIEWGLNNSPEGLNKDFTHCFFVTFNNEEDRAIYLPHPAHKAFVDLLSPHLDDVLVVDYWAK